MRRIVIVATIVALAQALAAFPPPVPQTPGATTRLRLIQVNAQTVTSLPRGKKYVADLTQRGVKYEFDSRGGQIDFSRVIVRTGRGDVEIGPFLEKTFLKGQLTGFKYASQSFSLGSPPKGTLQNPPTKTPIIVCLPTTCTCRGKEDCDGMIKEMSVCSDATFCATNPLTGEIVCSCIRRSPA